MITKAIAIAIASMMIITGCKSIDSMPAVDAITGQSAATPSEYSVQYKEPDGYKRSFECEFFNEYTNGPYTVRVCFNPEVSAETTKKALEGLEHNGDEFNESVSEITINETKFHMLTLRSNNQLCSYNLLSEDGTMYFELSHRLGKMLSDNRIQKIIGEFF